MPGSGYTVIVHRNGALNSRQLQVPSWLVRAGLITAVVLLVAAVAIVVSYGPVLSAALRAPLLQHRVNQLTRENARVAQLARELSDAEARYTHLRGMLGAQVPAPDGGAESQLAAGEERLYIAPPMIARAPTRDSTGEGASGLSVPSRWPLSVPSYRTRGMVADTPSEEVHPGIDLAVPEGSDVRASGGGIVERAGRDSSYGLFVLLQHPSGYQSMYGHLSRILVARGDTVAAGQVIALSGNTGRSTAPHLHFEVRLRGRSIDPTKLVREGP
ncbi:MAG TPA: M23 family metallopeptidase [Gemmatimonadales bacterium]|nr:M23 family metallopeptidase [Gemmatimonadales bacterium]